MTHTNITPEQAERFWSRVDDSGGPDSCWAWTRYIHPNGYGQFGFSGTKWKANRLAYFLAHDCDPGELRVLHSCDNPPCCNPAHLFLGTDLDNSHDSMRKGRRPKGESHWGARLTEEDVKKIRAMRSEGMSFYKIGNQLGFSRVHINRICSGRSWKHI